jgi:hypothetical protein
MASLAKSLGVKASLSDSSDLSRISLPLSLRLQLGQFFDGRGDFSPGAGDSVPPLYFSHEQPGAGIDGQR